MLDSYIKWFKAHELLLIVILALVFGGRAFDHYLDKSAAIADQKAALAIQAQAMADANSKALAAQSAQQQAQFAQALVTEQQQIANLTAAIVNRDAAAKNQIAKVTAPTTPTQAIVDLSTEYTLPSPLVALADGADVPTADLQLFTATKIEDVTAQSDLKDTQSELSGSQATLATCEGTVTDLQKQVTQDADDLKAHDTAAAAELKQAKADGRRGKWHWFWTGVVTGFVGRSIIK
jgi:uncharacterized membrane-anchored protein YhcB (DUF1043 family)